MSAFNNKIGLTQVILYKLSIQPYRYTALSKEVAKSASWSPHKFNQGLMWLCKENYIKRPEKKRENYTITNKGREFLRVLPIPKGDSNEGDT